MADYRISPNEIVDTVEKVLKDYEKDVVGKAVKKETKKSYERVGKSDQGYCTSRTP